MEAAVAGKVPVWTYSSSTGYCRTATALWATVGVVRLQNS